MTFFEILSHYIFKRDNPCEGAPTSSALIIAFAQTIECFLLNLKLVKILIFKFLSSFSFIIYVNIIDLKIKL